MKREQTVSPIFGLCGGTSEQNRELAFQILPPLQCASMCVFSFLFFSFSWKWKGEEMKAGQSENFALLRCAGRLPGAIFLFSPRFIKHSGVWKEGGLVVPIRSVGLGWSQTPPSLLSPPLVLALRPVTD